MYKEPPDVEPQTDWYLVAKFAQKTRLESIEFPTREVMKSRHIWFFYHVLPILTKRGLTYAINEQLRCYEFKSFTVYPLTLTVDVSGGTLPAVPFLIELCYD